MNDSLKKHDKYWQSRSLSYFHEYERNWLIPTLFTQGETVLDVAGGDGSVSEYLQKEKKCDVSLIDGSTIAIAKAKKRGIKKSYIVNVESGKYPFNDSAFDAVFWGDNIEHLYSPEKTIREIYRVLKPGGKLVLSTPNFGYWRYRIYYLIHGVVPQTEWIEDRIWNSQHIRFFNSQLLTKFLEEHKFSFIKVMGVNRRKVDKQLSPYFPRIFSMILVVSAIKS